MGGAVTGLAGEPARATPNEAQAMVARPIEVGRVVVFIISVLWMPDGDKPPNAGVEASLVAWVTSSKRKIQPFR
jgi:hypothetical protein